MWVDLGRNLEKVLKVLKKKEKEEEEDDFGLVQFRVR